MKKKYHILLFFSISVLVFLGLACEGQAMSLLPKRTFLSTLLEAVVVGLFTSIFFAIWARRRQRKFR